MLELAALLAAVGSVRIADVQIVDIDHDDELTRQYFDRIPVLVVDGELVCQYRFDKERVERCLGA